MTTTEGTVRFKPYLRNQRFQKISTGSLAQAMSWATRNTVELQRFFIAPQSWENSDNYIICVGIFPNEAKNSFSWKRLYSSELCATSGHKVSFFADPKILLGNWNMYIEIFDWELDQKDRRHDALLEAILSSKQNGL